MLGRSRGGLTGRIHLAADRRSRPLALILTVGQAGDSPQSIPLLAKVRVRLPVGRPRTAPGAVAGDKAYSSRGNRACLCIRGIKAVIPEERDQAASRKKKGARGGGPISRDAGLYKERNTVECLINRRKAWRGIATRYDCEDVQVPLRGGGLIRATTGPGALVLICRPLSGAALAAAGPVGVSR